MSNQHWHTYDPKRVFKQLRFDPKFRSLDDTNIDDAIGQAELEVYLHPEPPTNPSAAVYTRAKYRCVDFLREQQNEATMISLSSQPTGEADDRADLEPLEERERRARQPVLLSTVFRKLVRQFETMNQHAVKEAFERSCRNQSAPQIAVAMGLKEAKQVHRLLETAREQLWEFTLYVDHNRTVFQTLYRLHDTDIRPAERGLPRPSLNSEDIVGIKGPPSPLLTFTEAVDWVLRNTSSMCPAPQRLAEYWNNPTAAAFSDIAYHIIEAKCNFCIKLAGFHVQK